MKIRLLIAAACAVTAVVVSSAFAYAQEYNLTLMQEGGLPKPFHSEKEPDGLRTEIKDSLTNLDAEFEVYSADMSEDELAKVYEDVINHSPQLYYVQGTVGIDETDGGYLITPSYKEEYITLSSIPERTSMRNAVNDILAQVKPGMSDVEKVLAVHDYIVANYEYDLTYSIYDAKTFFEQKRGVCQAYTEALGYIFDELGIEWEIVTSDPMWHAWDMVKLDGKWYHLDATWDDPINDRYGRVYHDYFLLSDEAIGDEYHNHYAWDSNGKRARDNKYDDYFWINIDRAMRYHNGKWYWAQNFGTEYMREGINSYDFSDNTIENITDTYDVTDLCVYNNYIYFLCKHYYRNQGMVYMMPVNGAGDAVPVEDVQWGENLNGYYLYDGHLYYALTDDEYYEEAENPEHSYQAAYKDYYKYRHYYDIDLSKYKYSDIAPIWKIDEESGTLTVSARSGVIPDYGDYMKAPWIKYADQVKEIVINKGVKKIDANAFRNMSAAENLSLPDTLEQIGESAFYGCSAIRMITIPPNVTDIGSGAFRYCSGLSILNLGENVKNIGSYAFYGCTRLALVIMDKSIENIDEYAFATDYYLSELCYNGSEQDFDRIDIKDNNTYLTNADITYNYTPPMLSHTFYEGDNIILLNISSNTAIIGKPLDYSFKVYSYRGSSDYSSAEYTYDSDVIKIDRGVIYGLKKGKTPVIVKVGEEEVTFNLYAGEEKNTDMTIYISRRLIPFVASYSEDGELIRLNVLRTGDIIDSGIDYVDYGGTVKFMVWEDGFSSMLPAGRAVILSGQ